jgi:hypothetical protein
MSVVPVIAISRDVAWAGRLAAEFERFSPMQAAAVRVQRRSVADLRGMRAGLWLATSELIGVFIGTLCRKRARGACC